MIIEDPESFKSWLTTILEPLCDADPAALAKYVCALVKKDKPIAELRESMLSQLEVFLLTETDHFVDMLFEKLLSEAKGSTSAVASSTAVPTGFSTRPLSGSLPVSVATASCGPQETSPVKIKCEPVQRNKVSSPSNEKTIVEVDAPEIESDVVERERNAKEKDKERIEAEREVRELRDKESKDRERDKPIDKEDEKDEDKLPAVSSVPPVRDSVSLSNGQPMSSIISTLGNKRDIDRRSPHRVRDRNKSDSEKDDRPISSRTSRPSRRASSPRFRSRSRSWEQRHSRRSRSRDRERDRSRAWRNKSPPPRRYDRDRRRSWSRSPVRRDKVISRSRSRSRSRSPINSKFRSARYRNRSPPNHYSPRSHSHSPRDRAHRFDNNPLSGPATPTQDSNHELDLHLNLASQSIQSVVNVKDLPYIPKKRCRDFDEKGFCMRGDLCPFDHGSDPVVLEDVSIPQVLSYQTQLPPGRGPDMMVPPPGVNLPVPPTNLPNVMTQIIRPQLIRPQLNSTAEYNPDAPSMEPRMVWNRPPFRPPGGIGGSVRMVRSGGTASVYANYLGHQRELVNIPVDNTNMGFSHPSGFHLDVTNSGAAQRRTNFDFNRIGGGRHGGIGLKVVGHPLPKDNCSLELKKVPFSLNNITHLNNHFSKFGKIVNIQVCFDGDPEAALITFSSHAEANAAYKSTEAVLNNRFIKVFWHNTMEGKQENVPPKRPSIKERLGAPVSTPTPSKVLNTLQPSAVQTKEEKPSNEKVVFAANNLTKTMYIPTSVKKCENLQITTILPQEKKSLVSKTAMFKKTNEIRAAKETLKKKQEEKRKEAIKLTADLRKRKQELLDKQLKEQKLLIERLEKGGIQPEQREAIMNTLKIIQQSIEKTRKDLASVVTKMSVVKSANPVKTQRQILDAELDIFNQQQEGKDTSDLQKRVLELKIRANRLGLLNSNSNPAHYPTRGKFRSGRGRTTAFPHASVDHRTTKLVVFNLGKMSQTDVLAHFTQFGEIVAYDFDQNSDSVVLTYKSRKEAENAKNNGTKLGDITLSVLWFDENQSGKNDDNNVHRSIVLMCDGEEEEEEEEEEDDEDDDDDLLETTEQDGDELQLEEITEELELLHEDEQEDEEDEDRSWRR